ncbi:MAG: EscN/YscN/HrcN family type III secretion system ATPase, partial [Candidatus Neomarinimicrobiota bacterium]
LFTVLVENDDLNDPIADTARSVLDGHIVLSRELANRGHYPAVDILGSVSRLSRAVTDAEQQVNVQRVVEVLAVYEDSEDLINIGAYSAGSNPRIDYAIANIDLINKFLRQGELEASGFETAKSALAALCAEMGRNNGQG